MPNAIKSRLVDANWLLDEYCDGCEHRNTQTCFDDICATVKLIHAAPTVDAVEVVRCKDCKYRKRPLFAGCGGIYCEENRRHYTPDDFCSYGERRTEE